MATLPRSGLLRGVTLIELLVTISVLSLLMSLLLPAVQSAREAARRIECVNHLKQIGLAVHAYHDAHRVAPLGNDWRPSPAWGGWPFNASLHVRLLPYLEQAPLYDGVDFTYRMLESPNLSIVGASLDVFHCPSDPAPRRHTFEAGDLSPFSDEPATVGFNNYVGCSGSRYYWRDGAFQPQPAAQFYDGFWWEKNGAVRFADVTDGLSNTLMVGERSRARFPPEEQPWWGWWSSGFAGDTLFVTLHPINAANRVQILRGMADYTKMFGSAGSLHPGGANFCFGDGSVRFLAETIDSWDFSEDDIVDLWDHNRVTRQPKLYQWLSTRNGSEAAAGF